MAKSQKFNGQTITVKVSGKTYSKDYNGQGEGGGYRNKLSAYGEDGEKIGAVVPMGEGRAKVMKDGKVIGSIKYDGND